MIMDYKGIVKKTYRTFFWATAVSTIGVAVMNLLCILFAGMFFGADGSFVVGLALPIVIFAQIITYFFGVGGGIAVSIRQGQGSNREASQIFTLAIFGTAALGVLLALAGGFLATPLLPVLGAKTVAQQAVATEYIRILFYGMPAVLLCGVLNAFIRNDGRPKVAMTGIVISLVSNLLLLWLFIGIMKFGISGIALATVLSNTMCVLFYLWYFVSGKSTLRIEKSLQWKRLAEIARPGFSGSMIFLTQSVLTVFINQVLFGFAGADGIAAYGVVKYAITFVYAVYDSVNHAAQPMFSVYHGEGDSDSIQLTAKVAGRYLLVGAVALCLVLCFAAPWLSQVFALDVTAALQIIGVSCLFSSAVAFLNGLYRATGKSVLSLVFTLAANLVLPVLLIFGLVFVFRLEVLGVWLSLLGAEALTLGLILLLTRGNLLRLDKTDIPKETIYRALILNEETNVVALTEEIEDFCVQNGIDAKKQYYILLCIEEIAVNIIKHGFKDGKEHYIDIRILAGERVLLNIRDDALDFDPTIKKDADIHAPLDERNIGGLGIYLVKKVAKEFSYRRVIGFNNLHILL